MVGTGIRIRHSVLAANPVATDIAVARNFLSRKLCLGRLSAFLLVRLPNLLEQLVAALADRPVSGLGSSLGNLPENHARDLDRISRGVLHNYIIASAAAILNPALRKEISADTPAWRNGPQLPSTGRELRTLRYPVPSRRPAVALATCRTDRLPWSPHWRRRKHGSRSAHLGFLRLVCVLVRVPERSSGSPSVLATASRWESVGGKPKRERPFFKVFSKEIKFAKSGL